MNIHQSGVLMALVWLEPHETAVISAQVLCTPYNHAPCHFMQSHVCKVYACLAVTCHLHFWQNDWDLFHATVVTQGWNWYRSKSQHRKLTLENKILLPLLQGFEPATFRSWVWCSNHWAIPAPMTGMVVWYHQRNWKQRWPSWKLFCLAATWTIQTRLPFSKPLVTSMFSVWHANTRSCA